MKISIDMDEINGNEFGDSIATVIKEEIQYAVRAAVKAALKDRREDLLKDVEKVMAKYLSNMPSADDLLRLAQGPPRE